MNILVVKLSDIGDVLTVTPALRALREGLPGARITLLVPPHSAPVIEGSPLVDRIAPFAKARFDNPLRSARPGALASVASLLRQLRGERFDAVAIMHHLTTAWGAVKYAGLALGCGAPRRLGLDNGRGWFLTERVPDPGFGGRHEASYWLHIAGLLGGKVEEYPLEINLSPEDERFAEAHLPAASGPRIALHPGSGDYSLARRWPAIGFAEVARGLAERCGAQLLIVGSKSERDLAEEVAWGIEPPPLNLAGQTTLKQLGAVLKRCQLFIGNDSGVMHLAAAAGTPTVAIFGPSNPRAWGPWLGAGPGRAEVVRVDIPCSPCLYVGGRLGNRAGCAAMDCQNLVTPDMVLAAAERLLRSEGREERSERQGAGSEEREAGSTNPPLPGERTTDEHGWTQIGGTVRSEPPEREQASAGEERDKPIRLSVAYPLTPESNAHEHGSRGEEGGIHHSSFIIQHSTITILGIEIDNLTEGEAVERIRGFIEEGTPRQVVTVNPEFLVQARSHPAFRAALANADLALADGAGLLWASRLMGQPLKARVTGTDLVRKLANLCADKGYRVFLLGAAEGVAQQAAAVLRREYPTLEVVGTYAGSPSPDEEDAIIDMVSHARPHVLFVAYGAPGQDIWIARNLSRLGAAVAIGVGGAFDFVSGRVRRAPLWMRDLGLEWLYRLCQEPWRWRRMLRLPFFVWLVFWSKGRKTSNRE